MKLLPQATVALRQRRALQTDAVSGPISAAILAQFFAATDKILANPRIYYPGIPFRENYSVTLVHFDVYVGKPESDLIRVAPYTVM
jgi:hypothetical protein